METAKSPKVSIIMPAYNASATIGEAINSVLLQTYTDRELIVVDDCSSDNTVEIVKALAQKDPRIALHVNRENMGTAETRNTAVRRAKGEYLAFLDSDDMWRPDKLEKQLKLIEETGAVISYTGTAYMNASGEMSGYTLPAERKFTYRSLLRRNIMSCSSVMVRRDAMLPFPRGNMHEDYALWLQILRKTGCAYGVDEPLLVYRMAEGSKSAGRLRSGRMTYEAYRNAGYGKVRAVLLMVRYGLHSVAKRRRIKAVKA